MGAELKRRYIKGENTFWIGLVLLTTVALSAGYIVMIKKSAGKGCALDAVYLITQHTVFPMLALAAGVFNMKAIQNDSNSKIVMKYKTKKKLWFTQVMCSVFSAFILGVSVTFIAVISGYYVFGRFYNWESKQSFYRYTLLDTGVDYTISMSPILILVLSWIMTSLLFLLTFLIGMIANNITRSFSAAIVIMIIMAGADLFIPCFYSRLNLYLVNWVNLPQCLKKIGIVIVINIILFIAGTLIAPFREYYDKEV